MKTKPEGKGPGQAQGVPKKSEKAGLRRPDAIEAACYLLLICSAAMALWAMTRAIDKPLFGPHSFRQTQTAISAYYMAKDPSMFFNYITPVLGKPWEIPMELPVYQWLVARLHNLTGIELDTTGRIVSILAWFLCLFPAWMLLRDLGLPRPLVCITLAMLLSTPVYLFWGSSFLIESTGLLFAIAMVSLAMRGVRRRAWIFLGAATLCGTIAVLVKATTWAVAAGCGVLLLLLLAGRRNRRDFILLGCASAALLLPAFAGIKWLKHCDAVKRNNPFAQELLVADSDNQKNWNFGTKEQKLSPATWSVMARRISDQITGYGIFFLVVLLGFTFGTKRAGPVVAFFAAFVSGPIVFTNLYFEHSYYWFANSVWFVLAAGFAINSLQKCRFLRNRRHNITGLATAIGSLVVFSGYLHWFDDYLPLRSSLPSRSFITERWEKPVALGVPENGTLLVVGNDWNPAALYYARRKGLAFPRAEWIPHTTPLLKESISKLAGEERIGAVVLNRARLTDEEIGFFKDMFEELGVGGIPFPSPFGDCYFSVLN